jgi:hypothetical protein
MLIVTPMASLKMVSLHRNIALPIVKTKNHES